MEAWATVVMSAGASAVISAGMSLLAVSQATVRRAHAERADASRQAIRRAVERLLQELTRYRYLDRPTAKRESETPHSDDHTKVAEILSATRDLRPAQRWLVRRRCRKTFGHFWTDLAIDLPVSEPSGATTFTTLLTAASTSRELHPGRGPTDGLMHRAYATPAGHPLQAKLARNLRHLAACR